MRASPLQRLIFTAAGLLAVSSPGRADVAPPHGATTPAADDDAERHAKYAEYREKAIREFDAGRFAEARSYFLRAHELSPSARTLRTLGMTAFELRLYPRALIELRSALTDPRKPLDDVQRRHVEALVAETRSYVGELTLQLAPATLSLSVDGTTSPSADGEKLVLGAGEHQLVARAPGHHEQRITLTVEGGSEANQQITLVPIATPEPLPKDKLTSLHMARWVALGGGAAAVATGLVLGGLALQRKRTVEDDAHCPDERCPPPYHDELRELHHLANASTGAIVTGAVLLSVGTTLWLLERGWPSSAGGARAAALRVRF